MSDEHKVMFTRLKDNQHAASTTDFFSTIYNYFHLFPFPCGRRTGLPRADADAGAADCVAQKRTRADPQHFLRHDLVQHWPVFSVFLFSPPSDSIHHSETEYDALHIALAILFLEVNGPQSFPPLAETVVELFF